jgi:alkylation response protein AidB-like acyl-CoA dehydrogenase
MEFGLSSEQVLLKDSVDQFLREWAPLEQVRKISSDTAVRPAGLLAGLAEIGVTGLLIPESYGGVGLTMLDACLVAEVLGYRATPAPFVANAVMAPSAISWAGSEVQKREWLPKIAAGQLVVGVAMSELTGARSVAGQIAGVTLSDGRLSGRCLHVLDFEADAYIVADREGGLHWVKADAKGLTRRALETVDRTRPLGELVFVKVEAQTLPHSNAAICQKVIDTGRAILAADTLGAAQCMLDQAVAYAGQREQFGRPIASFQAVKHMCAEMAATLEPTRAFVWYAGHAIDHSPDEAHRVVCHLKAHIGEVARFVAKTATEVHGGMGFTDLVGLHYWFKRIGQNRQLLGSPERLRIEAARAQGLSS